MGSIGKTMGAAGALGLAVWAGCGGGGGSTLTGTSGAGGRPGLGIGQACSAEYPCRMGLVCDPTSHVCAAGHATPSGSPCVVSDECAMGLYCAAGVCGKAGSGMTGSGCTSDADCAPGLTCTLVGLGAECEPEGMGDVGTTCKTGSDCLGGLACNDGTCGPAAPGAPFGTLWTGVNCVDDPPPVAAYFRVPRGMNDGDFYRLPFPNDVRLVNGKPNLKDHPTPGPGLLGYDIVDRYLRAIESDNDGWGLYHTTFFRFSGEIDLSTLTGNVALVDLTKGSSLGLYYTYATNGGSYICSNWLGIRRAQGVVYEEGDTYAAWVTTGAKAMGGAPITRSPDLDAMLGASAPADPALAAAWPAYAPLRAYLTKQAIDPATILDATVFTVGKPTQPVAKLEPVIDAAPPPAASMWTRCDTGVASPCPDATGDRGCAAADPAFDELHALITLPIYQQGTAPYLTPGDGGFKLDAGGTPVMARTEQVCLSLTVPKGAPPMGGWPTLVFAHDTGGNFRTHVTSGVAADFAKGVDDGTGNVVKAAVLGIDQVANGTRRGASMASPEDLFASFGNPAAARGNVQQGAVDQMALRRFVPSVTFTAASSPTTAAFSLGAPVAFWGHAQGAREGGAALPFGAYGGAALSGQAASIIDTLLTKTSPTNVAAAVPFVLSDVDAKGKLVGGALHPVLSLLQTYLDGADPLAYARAVAAAPPMGVAPHHVFQPYGQGDTYEASVVQATYALAAALGLVAPDPSVSTPDAIGMLSTIPTPASGNLMVGGMPVSALIREYAPAAGKDGHSVVFDLTSARADTERFLAGVLRGVVPRVGM